jgi:hypothetical protein
MAVKSSRFVIKIKIMAGEPTIEKIELIQCVLIFIKGISFVNLFLKEKYNEPYNNIFNSKFYFFLIEFESFFK